MSQQGVQVDQEQFCCSICLDLLKHPVTVPCGHNYCSKCIEGYWSQDEQRDRFSCPQCRQTFNPRPVLRQNNMLADMMDILKRTSLQAATPPDHCYAGPGDVACDSCAGRKLRAVKTCLQCQVSFCDTHVQPHYQSPAFQKHRLDKASDRFHESGGYDVISIAADGTGERQRELRIAQQNVQQQRTQERETGPEPRTRADFLKYSRLITLDPNTANRYLSLSKENRKVAKMKQQQSCLHHPDRFLGLFQVLSKEALTGRCYWEVEWTGSTVNISVAYKSISRDYPDNRFGFNDRSWSLQHWTGDFTSCVFRHKSVGPQITSHVSNRVGVYLDHSAGTLSFYSVSDNSMTLLYRVQATFTQPLYAGFMLSEKTTIELVA